MQDFYLKNHYPYKVTQRYDSDLTTDTMVAQICNYLDAMDITYYFCWNAPLLMEFRFINKQDLTAFLLPFGKNFIEAKVNG